LRRRRRRRRRRIRIIRRNAAVDPTLLVLSL
jgi:hypothetical protein